MITTFQKSFSRKRIITQFFYVSLQTKVKNHLFYIMYTYLLLFGGLGINEIIIIALVVLLLFGGKKIPELMNGLGKGVKSFKDGMNDVTSTKGDSQAVKDEKGKEAGDTETKA